MGQPLWIRQLVSWLKLSSGFEQEPPVEEEWPDFFDNTDGIGLVKRELFYKSKGGVLLPFKGRPSPVEVETKIGLEAHITGCNFGTSKRARKFWRGLIDSGDIPEDVWKLYGQTPKAAAQRMALHARFWKVPYHWVGLRNGDVIHNNDISRYTYHGNGGNGLLVGVSLEGNYKGVDPKGRAANSYHGYTEHIIETGRTTLRLATNHSRDLGAPIEWLYAHRQYSGGRTGDPGEGWWKEIGIPVAKEMDLKINYGFKHSSGKKIPVEWDENGLVDFRGRPIKTAA